LAGTAGSDYYVPRSKVLVFDTTGGQQGIIDNNWKVSGLQVQSVVKY
jgi:hypothetical protein